VIALEQKQADDKEEVLKFCREKCEAILQKAKSVARNQFDMIEGSTTKLAERMSVMEKYTKYYQPYYQFKQVFDILNVTISDH
jgi:hypothetical protein